jgi:hypothetical protein
MMKTCLSAFTLSPSFLGLLDAPSLSSEEKAYLQQYRTLLRRQGHNLFSRTTVAYHITTLLYLKVWKVSVTSASQWQIRFPDSV